MHTRDPRQVNTAARSGMRLIGRGASVFVLAMVFVALAAPPAFAHASLDSTSPATGAVLTETPAAIVLEFTEPVTVSLGGIRLFDEDADRIATGQPTKPDGNTVSVSKLGNLPTGSYVVTWRVTSADSHPVQGAFTFQIGTAGNATGRDVTGLADQLLADQNGSRIVGAAWGITRWLAFVGIALLVGSVVFCVAISSRARTFARTRRIVFVGWGVLTFATIAGFVLQGPYASGLGLSHVVDPALWGDVAGTRFGLVWLGRLVVLFVGLGLLLTLFGGPESEDAPSRPPTWWLALASLCGLALVASPAVAGHSTAGEYVGLALLASAMHVAAMSVWLGGLGLMGAVVVRGDAIDERDTVVARFSRVAMWCVLTLIATGAFQTWRQVRSVDALRNTDFGHILVIKLVVFAVVAVFAVFSREIVGRLFATRAHYGDVPVVAGGSEDLDPEVYREWKTLRRSIWAEALLGIAVLAITAVLVNATPAATAAGTNAGGAAGVTMRTAGVVVDVTVAPAQAGRNDIHLSTFTPAGAPLDVAEVTMTFDLPSRQIGAIDVPLRDLGPGHYLSPGFDIPIAGDWRVMVKVRLTDVDQVTLTDTVQVR